MSVRRNREEGKLLMMIFMVHFTPQLLQFPRHWRGSLSGLVWLQPLLWPSIQIQPVMVCSLPTHVLGNILDLIQSNDNDLISDLSIDNSEKNKLTSDHITIVRCSYCHPIYARVYFKAKWLYLVILPSFLTTISILSTLLVTLVTSGLILNIFFMDAYSHST